MIMGSYINPYYMNTAVPMNGYPYPGQSTAVPMPQQSYAMQPTMSSNVIPVDGEVGAKAYMVPTGSTGPIALWDTNDNVIYLRTFNAAGMPNPLRKLRYTEEAPMQNLSGGTANEVDTSQFVTKKDFDELRQEIQNLMNNKPQYQNNQNRSGNVENRRG
jgi:hypothetical protein